MTTETLQTAKRLEVKIQDFTHALNCFEWVNEKGDVISNHPHLIIEFDDDEGGREQIKLPMNLNDAFIAFMKEQITEGRDAAINELANL